MSWHFWIIPLAFFWFFGFRRGFGPRHWNRHRSEPLVPSRDPELIGELDSQRDVIGALEARVAELENRLDFTERLLSSRHQSESAVT
jgi:hypothetical protein